MNENETWPLSDGRCFIDNGEINFCKQKGKKEKVTKYEVSSIISMEKELKHDWVQIQFRTDGKTVKKEFSFKNTGDGEKFINSVLQKSPSSKFEERTEKISAYNAVKRPLSILFYFLLCIVLILAINYGLDFAVQIFNLNTVDVPVVFWIIMQIVHFLGNKTCLIIIGVIALLCLLGALVRLIKRPEAKLVQCKEI